MKSTCWHPGMTAAYTDGKTYPIASCDFEENLVGLQGVVTGHPDEISWVRCENITLKNRVPAQNAGNIDKSGVPQPG